MSAGRVVRKLYHDSCAPTGLNPEMQLMKKSAALLGSNHLFRTPWTLCRRCCSLHVQSTLTARFTQSIAIILNSRSPLQSLTTPQRHFLLQESSDNGMAYSTLVYLNWEQFQ